MPVFPLDPELLEPGFGLLHVVHVRLTGPICPGNRGSDRRMSGKRQFLRNGEDAVPVGGSGIGSRLNERGLGQIEPPRQRIASQQSLRILSNINREFFAIT